MKEYECDLCGYVYDPKVGDPDNGIKPGTAFEDLPRIGFALSVELLSLTFHPPATNHVGFKERGGWYYLPPRFFSYPK